MISWTTTLTEARESRSLLAVAVVLVVCLLVRIANPEETRGVRTALFCLAVHILLLPVAGTVRDLGTAGYREIRLALFIFEALALISAICLLLFATILPRV